MIRVWLYRKFVDRLSQMRGPGESQRRALSHQSFLLPTTCFCARSGLSEPNGLTN